MLPENLTNQLTNQTQAEKPERVEKATKQIPFLYDVPKYSINLDQILVTLKPHPDSYLLSLNKEFTKDIHSVTDRIQLKKLYNNFANFNSHYSVYLDSKFVGEIKAESRKKENPDIVQFKFSNELLYQSNGLSVYNYIIKELNLIENNISAVDIACDGYDLHLPFKALWLYSKALDKSQVAGVTVAGCQPFTNTPTETPIFEHIGNAGIYPSNFNKDGYNGFYIGLKKTGKQVVIYDKTSEIKESEKHYITQHWQRCGLDISRQIDRCELRLGYEYLKKYQKDHGTITVTDLFNKTFIQTLFKLYTQGCIKFNDLRTKQWVNGNDIYQEVSIINFDVLKTVTPVKIAKVSNPLPTKESVVRGLKMTFKRLAKQYLTNGNDNDLKYLQDYIQRKENNLSDTTYSNEFYYKRLVQNVISSSEFKELYTDRVDNLHLALFNKIDNYQITKETDYDCSSMHEDFDIHGNYIKAA